MSGQPLRVLVAGYGFAGGGIHHPLIRTVDDLTVTGIVTGDADRCRLALERDPSVAVYETAEEALTADRFDVVVIATPNDTHADLALRAIEYGAAIVVDKPLAPTTDAATLLVEAAEKSGVPLTVFHNRRWDGDLLTVARLLARGDLGELLRVTSRFDRWQPSMTSNWRNTAPEQGGGILLDLASHLVDQVVQLLGPVVEVYAEVNVRQPGLASEDEAFLSLLHVQGRRSHLFTSALEGNPALRFHVSGSAGAYVKHGFDIQEEHLLAGLPVEPGHSGREPRERWGQIHRGKSVEIVDTAVGDWTEFYRRLVRSLRHGQALPVDPHEALHVMAVLDAARTSARQRQVVSVKGRGLSQPLGAKGETYG